METKQEIREKLIEALREILGTINTFSDRQVEMYFEAATGIVFDEAVDSIFKASTPDLTVDTIIKAMKIYVLS